MSSFTFTKANSAERMNQARSNDPDAYDKLIRLSDCDFNDFSKCWESKLSKSKDGYTQIRIRGIKIRSHRLMYSLFHPDKPDPEVVRHICHNPTCINPAHLRGGTPKDNAIDRVLANRGGNLKGTNNGRSKLTEKQVIDIFESKEKNVNLSKKYKVSETVIGHIKSGKLWSSITGKTL